MTPRLIALVAIMGLGGLGAACGTPKSEPAPQPFPQPTAPLPAAPIADASAAASSPLAGHDQVLTAIVADWTTTTAELRLWKRTSALAGETWELELGPWPGVVGATGLAWGIGLHGTGAPPGAAGPVKREGDRKAPAGVFGVRELYGYGHPKPAAAPLRYTEVDARWKCVDDPASRHYARIVDRSAVTVDWKSAEDMRRPDELYRWVVDVAHNPGHAPGAGSCIFLHVWRDATSPTVGCTAMAEDRLATLIDSLGAAAVVVQLPAAEYAALVGPWGLPPLPTTGR
ncbi:MAG: hypothetical protein H0T89_35275 [Deltaproteobacteria bacterium]|nr:hypothetical protein [Deltaproteobacteria bacterium]